MLNPIDYNYMVTPKEIDFLIDKLSLLIGHGLNMALHNNQSDLKLQKQVVAIHLHLMYQLSQANIFSHPYLNLYQ